MNERSPHNTSADDPVEKLLVAASPHGIEEQEAQGQRQMVNADTLPSATRPSRDEFEALGFTFGAPVDGDDMFVRATLPEGWTRKGSEHAMWSYIADERGIDRVAIFYKAAFYDRDAFMNILNVGSDIASRYVYGDGDGFTPPADLTDDERESARSYARRYLDQAAESPDIYGDRASRAQTVFDVI